jgi:hypothetical protein
MIQPTEATEIMVAPATYLQTCNAPARQEDYFWITVILATLTISLLLNAVLLYCLCCRRKRSSVPRNVITQGTQTACSVDTASRFVEFTGSKEANIMVCTSKWFVGKKYHFHRDCHMHSTRSTGLLTPCSLCRNLTVKEMTASATL